MTPAKRLMGDQKQSFMLFLRGGRRWTRVHTQESTRVPEVADLSLLGTSQPVAGRFGVLRPLANSPMVMFPRAHGLYVTETRLDAKEFTTSIGRS